MDARCMITEFKKSYDNSKDKFPFTCADLAHMMKFMSENFNSLEAYKPAFDIFE